MSFSIDIRQFSNSDAHRAKIHDLIPGGAHTYSKGDDQFPHKAPAAIVRGEGPYVWDIDGNRFLDGLMGLTSVGLGHGFPDVVNRVCQTIRHGTNFSRPSVMERELAERFLELVPQHDMIKFAKNGSTVTTAAVKLARAATGRELVAFPYDHPFYSYDDWFIGSTACSRGVPESTRKHSVTYKADDFESLKELFEAHPGQIACVISEPEKTHVLAKGHLQSLIDLAHEHGALYIADEMITGFKSAFPGSITKFNAVPDLATWGKGIANGFSFTCITGKRDVMELGGIRRSGEEKVFLTSTTHGGETGGLAAALATIDVYQKRNVVEQNQKWGDVFMETVQATTSSHGLEPHIELKGFNWCPSLDFKNHNGESCMGLRTLFNQEMIRRGVLFQGIFCPSFSHTQKDMDLLAEALDHAMGMYTKGLEDGYERYLQGEPIKPVFRKHL